MRYLLDTNVVSETRKKRPNQGVIGFMSEVDSKSLFLSVLTLGEIRKGIRVKRATDTLFSDELDAWVQILESTFVDRLLKIDAAVARR